MALADPGSLAQRTRMVCHDWCRFSVPVCYDFSCKNLELVGIPDRDWKASSGWFFPAAETPEAEREQIQRAIGWMEVVIGKLTPTHNDRGQNLPAGAVFPGQLDCIDESSNTTAYLKLFESRGLLRWHKVVEKAYRRSMMDQHYAGQVLDVATGERYVVDSWFHDNGYLPYIQLSRTWVKVPLWTSYVDNSD